MTEISPSSRNDMMPSSNFTVVEISKTNESVLHGGLCVCDSVRVYDGQAYMQNAIIKKTIKKEKVITVLDIYNWGDSRIGIDSSADYAIKYKGLMVPASRILSIFKIEDLEDFPNTRLWSSRTLEQAEAICNQEIAAKEKEYADKAPEQFRSLENKWKRDLAFEQAKEEWIKMPWFRRIGKNDNDFIRKRTEELVSTIFPTKFYDRLENAGLPWREWKEMK